MFEVNLQMLIQTLESRAIYYSFHQIKSNCYDIIIGIECQCTSPDKYSQAFYLKTVGLRVRQIQVAVTPVQFSL